MSHHKPIRRGTSLIEALVVMTLLSTILAGTVSGIVALQRVDRRITTSSGDLHDLRRLAADLRTDIAAASEAAWRAEDSTLMLTTAGADKIQYAFETTRCRRSTGESNAVYRLPAECSVACDAGNPSESRLVELVIQVDGGESKRLVVALSRIGQLKPQEAEE